MAETAKRYNSIIDIIDKRLIPDDVAKKLRGEVFTPLNLVREMLLGIRKGSKKADESEIWGIDKEGNFFDDDENDRIGGIPLAIWRDPETKWLDPANGIGNFPVIAFYMLDYQLGKHGPKGFKGDDNKWSCFDKYPNQVNVIPLQQTATDILGLEFKEVNHGLNFSKGNRLIKGKYVVIGPNATAGCKEWNISHIRNICHYPICSCCH